MAALIDFHRPDIVTGNNTLAIDKFNLSARSYCTVENVNVVIYLLVLAFQTVFNIHLPCQLLCRSFAAQ